MNVYEHLATPAALFPDHEALVFEGQRYSYASLLERSRTAAAQLKAQGINRGDRVGIALSNSTAFVVWYYAVARVGAIAVSVSTRLTPEETEYILNDCDVAVLAADSAKTETLQAGFKTWSGPLLGINAEGILNEAEQVEDSPSVAMVNTSPDEPTSILYTSGTTGFPKGATLTHQNVRATVHAFNHLCDMRPSDRLLCSVPLFHCYGQNALLNSGFNAGATVVLQRNFDLHETRRLIIEEKITQLYGVPTMFQLLAEACSAEDLASVRYCFSAATTLPLQTAERWREKFGMPIHEGYGLTETAPFASYNHRLLHVPGSIGVPVDLCEMKIVDPETGSECSPGELGEIAIRGPNVMQGYWNRPDDTAAVLKDGWFHSGDIGRVDERGYYYIVDRVKDMISVGGIKVFPAEVERILLNHPRIREAAVVGVADDVFGERVAAFLTLNPAETNGETSDINREEVRALCQQHLAPFKVPGHIHVIDELPRNPAGKILKTKLREQAAELSTQQPVSVESSNDSGNRLAAEQPAATEPTAWRQQLERIHPDRRGRWLAAEMQRLIGELNPDLERPEINEPLLEYGLDSLMIVDLRERLQTLVGQDVELPVTLIFDAPTIARLSDHLSELLQPQSSTQEERWSDVEPSNEEDTTEQDRAEIAAMSEEDAVAELMRELDQQS